MTLKRRTRVFLDPKVQGSLILKVVQYWCLCLVTVVFFRYCCHLFPLDPSDNSLAIVKVLKEMWLVMLASLFVLPVVIIDVVRWSNKFAGPAHRLHKALGELATGRDVTKLTFRTGDFWQEAADAFNSIAGFRDGQSDDKDAEKPSEEVALKEEVALEEEVALKG